jgi:putative FmdB family regulatory protein
MPIYDYECSDCGENFEALVLRGGAPPACPSCQSLNLKQQISLFAVDSASTRQSHLSAARRKSAKVARDKSIAEHEQAMRHHDD